MKEKCKRSDFGKRERNYEVYVGSSYKLEAKDKDFKMKAGAHCAHGENEGISEEIAIEENNGS